ncbi:MAG: hypothetical protein JXB26_00550 [Candidatus Aminicenantes bacterium]|nr:hypothetical protein [Candidatus Aminicenantes bacterium]
MQNLYTSVPDEIKGWAKLGEDEVYNRETLFDYMNGGAEVYLAFDFRCVFVRKYSGPGENEISLDIYDMGSSSEAFGIFSCDREDESIGIGQGSEFGPGLLRFWKDKYFVSVMAMGDEKQAETAMIELAKAVERIIPDEGTEPEMLHILPKKGLRKDKISYFHSVINLNNRFFIAGENILQLTDKTDCIFAEYSENNQDMGYLLVVRYETDKKAQTAFQFFLQAYMPEAAEKGEILSEDGQWTVSRLVGNTVRTVFEARDRDTALKILSEIKS